MTRREPKRGAGFHELPLVLFTALAIGGAGVGTAHLTLFLLGWVPLAPAMRVMALLGVLLGVGLLFSVGHLGRPFRSALALFRIGRSPLSNEVLVVGVALAASLVSLALPAGHFLVVPLTVTALVSSVLTLLALGLVYRLPGQLTWGGPVLAQPLVLGVAFGLTVLLGALPAGTRARGELLILLILLVDGLLVWERTRRTAGVLNRGVPTHPRFLGQRGSAVILRILMGILLPAAALLWGRSELAGIFLFLNLFLDRFLFYGLAVRCGTEAEVERAETALRAGADSLLEDFDSTPSSIPAGER
jgi:DMSO reductase anchor subunit